MHRHHRLRRHSRIRALQSQRMAALRARCGMAVVPPRRLHVALWLTLICVALASLWVWQELRSSTLQARIFAHQAAKMSYRLAPGPSTSIRFPDDGPYDVRLGYTALPEFLARLQARGYTLAAQAQISPAMAKMRERGYFAVYPEKTAAGLTIYDCSRQILLAARFPERRYESFAEIPALLTDSLLFIENRELLDARFPKRNPALEWDRLSKAIFDKSLQGVTGGARTPGGSTLATQMEKYRHSPEGRTATVRDKFRQMLAASLRAYQNGEDTAAMRRRIVLDYLNSVPLSARAGYGEVNGIGDGMWVWYGRELADFSAPLREALDRPQAAQRAALSYKQVLSLLIAQRSPSHFMNGGARELEQLTNSHLRVLAAAGVIPAALRDAALKQHLQRSRQSALVAGPSFVSRKAANAVRTQLTGLLGDTRLYNLDRLDLSVQSTLNAEVQTAVTEVLRSLRDPARARAAGLTGKGLLGKGDPAEVVYSFTLLEKGADVNYLRVQTDNFEQPLDINEGVRLDLGSTAKLRTLVTYLDIVAQLQRRYGALDRATLAQVAADPRDTLTRWALAYLAQGGAADLPAMLEAALERRYSANPAEGFMTGGGLHHFENFKKEDNGRVLSVREALRNSVNLPFVRLMRDVVHFYMFQSPGSSATLLSDASDPRRAAYLSRFADREGREFLQRFYYKYQGKSAVEAEQILLGGMHVTALRLANVHRTIAPNATLAEFSAFLKAHLPGANEVSGERIAAMYAQYAPEAMSLSDRAYLATVHPLELWVIAYLRQHPQASLSQVIADSGRERQEIYQWLFKTSRKHAQDKRIAGLLEVEGFLEIHRQWKRMGYPFASMTPSYASALGASADRPAALAELMGIIVNGGVRKPAQRISLLHFAAATPYESVLTLKTPPAGEPVLAPGVARAVADVLREVVQLGTGRRVRGAFTARDGSKIAVAGKTGTGDQRFDVFGAGGRLIESRFVNRSATFVFNIGERFFGSMTAYVHGSQSKNYDFTSALPVQLLTVLAPSLLPLVDPPPDAPACRMPVLATLPEAPAILAKSTK